jgi:D-alanine-D-alanine ligase
MRHYALDTARILGPVAVLLGGSSAEREVSLDSGTAVHAALARRLPGVLAMDAKSDVLPQLIAAGVRHAFISLHGGIGEDGTLQGALSTLGISHTGSGVLACALAMDKLRCKRFWQAEGIPTPIFEVAEPGRVSWDSLSARLGKALIVKPASEGSSIGVTPVDDAAALVAAVELAASYDDCVLVEQRIIGPEYTVAIVDGEVLPSICLETPRTFYDYEAKYRADTTRYLCPSGLDADAEQEIRSISLRAFESLGCRGWGRVDLMRDAQTGKFLVLEVNTSPGMTSHSLVPMAAAAVGIDFENLVVRILNASLQGTPA